MTNTTTEHIKALLVNDGREFAMIRKADLAALMQIAETDPHQGGYLDPLGVLRSEVRFLQGRDDRLNKRLLSMLEDAHKHGEERRRYMANNRALQRRIDTLEYAAVGMKSHWEEQRRQMFDYVERLIACAEREARLESRLLRVARFKRKFPAIGALMEMTP